MGYLLAKLKDLMNASKGSVKLAVRSLYPEEREGEGSWEEGKVLLTNLFEAGFASSDAPQDLHLHERSYELYVICGKGKAIVGEETLSLEKGDLLIIKPGVPHKVELEEGFLYAVTVPGGDKVRIDEVLRAAEAGREG